MKMIKLAVDIEQEILAGGGELHADCEQVLLENGSLQENVWGADWYPEVRRVGFESLINIRPRQQNRSMEIKDPVLREKIEIIVKIFGVKDGTRGIIRTHKNTNMAATIRQLSINLGYHINTSKYSSTNKLTTYYYEMLLFYVR